MDELKLSLTGAQLGQKLPPSLLQSLRVGQVLTMTVVGKPEPGALLLQAGAHQVAAKANIPVQLGSVLTLEVSSLGVIPSLRIVTPGSAGTAQSAPLDRYLKLLAPAQGEVLTPLQTLLDPVKNANILSLLGFGNAEAERILKTLTQAPPIDVDLLKNAVERSGLFLESDLRALLAGLGALKQGDLKAVLSSILFRVKQALAKPTRDRGLAIGIDNLVNLQAELEGALAKISLKQLSVFQAQERGALMWSFEIPVRLQNDMHSIELKIKREGNASERERESEDWKVLLSVNLPKLGPVEAELFMRASKVSVVIYAQQAATATWVDASLPQLKSGLESAGLSVSVLLCHQGSLTERNLSDEWDECVDEKV